MFDDYQFANPKLFWLYLIMPIILLWYIFKNKKQYASLSFSAFDGLDQIPKTLKIRLRHLPFVLRFFSIALLIFCLARPQSTSSRKSVNSEGIDIVITMDISSSMLAQDFKPNRLEVAKEKAIEFITERTNDRVGLTIFAGEAFTQSPITIDHDVVKNLLRELETGLIKDGTAIGDGLATAINRLKDSKAESKVAILLTDGVSNTGFIAPETAADLASTFGIKVYTIGIGTMGKAPYPTTGSFGQRTVMMDVEIDEEILQNIANLTGGKYFRATDNESLQEVYKQIDELEKTKIDVSYYNNYSEEFLLFALLATGLFLVEIILKYTYLRTLS